MSHTPGPWYVHAPEPALPFYVSASAEDYHRGEVAVLYGKDSGPDARLIAAAPDLLAFAESVVTLFAKEYPQAGLHLDMDKASLLNAAREVIKKARDQ